MTKDQSLNWINSEAARPNVPKQKKLNDTQNSNLKRTAEIPNPAMQTSLDLSESSKKILNQDSVPRDKQPSKAYWDFVNQTPELMHQKHLELQAHVTRNKSALLAAQTQLEATQNELNEAQQAIFKHPAHYLGAGLLAVFGGCWLLERRKRLRMETHFLEIGARGFIDIQTSQSGVLIATPRHALVSAAVKETPLDKDETLTELEPPSLANLSGKNLLSSEQIQPHSLSDANNSSAHPIQTEPPVQAPALKDTDWMQDEEARLAFEQEMAEHEMRLKEYRVLPAVNPYIPVQTPATPIEIQQEESIPSPNNYADANNLKQTKSKTTVIGLVKEDESDDLSVAGQPVQSKKYLDPELYQAKQRAAPTSIPANFVEQTPVSTSHQEQMEMLLELRMMSAGMSALGRHSEAILILDKQIQQTPKTCAWVYLEHMHLCAVTGDRHKFEDMRKLYQSRFKHVPPYWNEPNSDVLGLESYARASVEIAEAWRKGYAPSLLISWAIGSENARRFFQRPAYQDLFDLYELLEYLKTNDMKSQG